MGEMRNDGAPVVQLLLTMSFEPGIQDVTVLDLAEMSALYREEFPAFRQINRVGPMSAAPDDDAPNISVVMGLPRMSLSSSDAREYIYIQEDRISFGWTRTTPIGTPHDYPGFSAILSRLLRYAGRLSDWAASRGDAIRPNVGEIVYTDAFALTEGKRLSSILTMLNPDAALTLTSFSYDFGQPWPCDRQGYIQASFRGPALSPEGDKVAVLESTTAFSIDAELVDAEGAFREAHRAITDVFEGLVSARERARPEG